MVLRGSHHHTLMSLPIYILKSSKNFTLKAQFLTSFFLLMWDMPSSLLSYITGVPIERKISMRMEWHELYFPSFEVRVQDASATWKHLSSLVHVEGKIKDIFMVHGAYIKGHFLIGDNWTALPLLILVIITNIHASPANSFLETLDINNTPLPFKSLLVRMILQEYLSIYSSCFHNLWRDKPNLALNLSIMKMLAKGRAYYLAIHLSFSELSCKTLFLPPS